MIELLSLFMYCSSILYSWRHENTLLITEYNDYIFILNNTINSTLTYYFKNEIKKYFNYD